MSDNEYIVTEKDLYDDELIDRFMQGQMNEEEENKFLEELDRNNELREKAILHARLVKGMAQVDNEIIDAYKEAEENSKNEATIVSFTRKSSARWLAVAASVVFIIFVGFKSYDYYDTTSLGKKFAKTFPTTSIIVRGETNADVETELSTLFNNIVEGKDLDDTTSRLAMLWDFSKQETYNDYTDYAPYIGWNLAVGYLRNYEKGMARNILSEMETMYDNETIIGQKVRELIKTIE